jgi:hypothetical protein
MNSFPLEKTPIKPIFHRTGNFNLLNELGVVIMAYQAPRADTNCLKTDFLAPPPGNSFRRPYLLGV